MANAYGRRGLKRLLVGVGAMILAPVLYFSVTFFAMFGMLDSFQNDDMVEPAGTYEVAEPGVQKFLLVMGGSSGEPSGPGDAVSATPCRVEDPSGTPVSVTRPAEEPDNSDDSGWDTLATFTPKKAGPHRIDCGTRVKVVDRDVLFDMGKRALWVLGLSLGLLALVGLFGLVLTVWGIVLMATTGKRPVPAGPGPRPGYPNA